MTEQPVEEVDEGTLRGVADQAQEFINALGVTATEGRKLIAEIKNAADVDALRGAINDLAFMVREEIKKALYDRAELPPDEEIPPPDEPDDGQEGEEPIPEPEPEPEPEPGSPGEQPDIPEPPEPDEGQDEDLEPKPELR